MRYLRGHSVTRARELGWHSLSDGSLLDKAEKAGFEVLITCDQSIRFQQNFTNRKIAVVTLSTNHWRTLGKVSARIASTIDFIQRGQVVKIEVSTYNYPSKPAIFLASFSTTIGLFANVD